MYIGTFQGCTSLASVVIPTSVTAIDGYVFDACASLTEVTLPLRLESLGGKAFRGCSALNAITCRSWQPPVAESDAFDDAAFAGATLYVPEIKQDEYSSAAVWSRFSQIIASGIDGVSADNTVKVYVRDGVICVDGLPEGALIEVYSVDGSRVASTACTGIAALPKGVYVVVAAGKAVKVAI